MLLWAALLPALAAQPASAATVRSGTGFYVSATGQLLTSAHGVAGCRHVTLWPTDGDGVPATVTAIEQRLDVALLTIRPHDLPHGWAAVRGLRPAMAGEPAYSIAFGVQRSLPRAPVFTRGTVGGIGSTPALHAVTVVEARMEPGSSGAPLIDATGTLLGLVIGRYSATPERTVAVPAPALARFLAHHGVALSHDDTAPGTPDALLTAMSVLVQCAPPARAK